MKCENCIHKKPCGEYQQKFLSHLKNLKVTECPYYKEKDKVIDLPCKVGDTVYYFSQDYDTILPYFVENLNIAYLGEKDENYVYTFEANCTRENELLDSIDFEPDDIGKTIFLTKEEAEKALKELKENEG